MIFTEEDKKDFENAKECYVCGGKFNGYFKDLNKCRDHCHFSGKYRGAAHNKCNLIMKKTNFIPVFFHNLEGYDSHLFIRNLGVSEGDINCIPKTEEKYISFSKNIEVDNFRDKKGRKISIMREIRFIDSFKFMSVSLESLGNNLEKDQFHNVNKVVSGRKRELMLKKGVFPYEYMDCLEKLDETELAEKEKFYSKLNDRGVTDEEYEHAKNVWNEFEMETMRNYHDLYMTTDVLVLADIFENFRKICMENDGLDPCMVLYITWTFFGMHC